MKIQWNVNGLTVRLNKWDYRIYMISIPEKAWKAERRRIGSNSIWEDFDQNLIPKSVARQAVKYWKHQTVT